ncbi:unnamed protein product [Adineta steineri]|uniref:Uncharacterized protein n=1 Tax=Adineta steineri TaxID=433720 RepID=A0A814P5L1_9BILA|nr:unnamed protein product [Adineta steineri]
MPQNSSSTYYQSASSRTTSRQRSTTKSSSLADFDEFSENLKRAALILAGIALCLGIFRVCLMLCKSRSRTNSVSNHHLPPTRSNVSTIEQHQFKPDLPPEYAEVIANIEHDSNKLPSYDELPYDQQQEQHVYNNDGFISTQM